MEEKQVNEIMEEVTNGDNLEILREALTQYNEAESKIKNKAISKLSEAVDNLNHFECGTDDEVSLIKQAVTLIEIL